MSACVEPVEALGSGAGLRKQLYSGRIAYLAASEASLRWAEETEARIRSVFAPHVPATAEATLPNDEWIARLSAARAALLSSNWIASARALVAGAGLDVTRSAIDAPRLRAVKSGGHRLPAATPAYFAHRDTWYGNPRAQLNFWLALHDVPESQTFRLYPDAFNRPVRNDSSAFDLASFHDAGGFQAIGGTGARRYPRALVPEEWGDPVGFSLKRGECLLFSGAHLHATRGHDGGRTRFSLDFRCVDLDDGAAGRGAPDLDDASTGDTLPSFVRPP